MPNVQCEEGRFAQHVTRYMIEVLISASLISLDDPKVRAEISYQLSYFDEVIAWYSGFKCDGGNVSAKSALFASGCSAVGFFSSSSIMLSAKRGGMSIKELFSAGSGTLSWYGAGFVFHFLLLMSSFHIQDELRMDQQWLAQLLMCYRSSLLRLILLLNHHAQNDDNGTESENDVKSVEEILRDAEGILKRFDEELDSEQIGQWMQYPVSDNISASQAVIGLLCVPGTAAGAMHHRYRWNPESVRAYRFSSQFCKDSKVQSHFQSTGRSRRLLSRFLCSLKRCK